MFRDPLVQKAWEVRQQAEHFPTEVPQEASTWLEEQYRKALSEEIAIALVLQYLVLAMRRIPTSPTAAKDYFSRALHWREEAKRTFSAPCPLPTRLSLN